MIYLPRELWIMILKIKWYNARKRWLLDNLQFPVKFSHYFYTYQFRTGGFQWVITIDDSRLVIITEIRYYKLLGDNSLKRFKAVHNVTWAKTLFEDSRVEYNGDY